MINPIIDERTELLGVIFRLAGSKEYNNNYLKNYSTKIDNYFLPYKDHKVVKYAKELSETKDITYDAVMSIAIHIRIENETINLRDNITEDSLDKRWHKYKAKFIEYLTDFYQKSKFTEFFNTNKEYYKKAKLNFDHILDSINFNWFDKYYRVSPNKNFNLVISLTNGGCNYGPKVKFKKKNEDLYAIIGSWKTDSLGFPIFVDNFIESIIIHEFCHSYCNHLIDENYFLMEETAEKIYELVKDKMQMQAYGDAKTMLYEILVRASVIRYYQSKIAADKVSKEYIDSLIINEKKMGFFWIPQLINLLSQYELGEYKSLGEFIPEIIKLQYSLSTNKKLINYKEA